MMKFRLSKRNVSRSRSELRADSATIRYELDMLIEAAQRYGVADARKDLVGKNMAVESFAVHFRALLFFLYGHVEGLEAPGLKPEKFGGERDTDVFAWDYYNGWQHDCPEPSTTLYHAKVQADKHVAHITTERRGLNQPGTGRESLWQLQDTTNELVRAFGLFLSKTPQANFDPEELRKMQTQLAPPPVGSPAPSAPFIGRSGPLDEPKVMLQGKTDARTIPLTSGFYPHGKTE